MNTIVTRLKHASLDTNFDSDDTQDSGNLFDSC